jgi:flagellar protein FliO/FliZ
MDGLFIRAILSLGAVVGVMGLAARAMRGRFGVPNGPRGTPVRVEVLARQTLGKSASIAVVRAAGKSFVVGITESSVTVLTDADPDVLPPLADDRPEDAWTAPLTAGASRARPTWKTLMQVAREQTVRRS